MVKVLVTGGLGFIGRHTVRELVAEGHTVRIVDTANAESGFLEAYREVDFVKGDIRDPHTASVTLQGCDAVIHLAAMSRSGPSTPAWEECVTTNINGTANLLHHSILQGVQRFVYAGSSTFYGNQRGPHTTDMRSDYLNFYGLSKGVGEDLVRQFHKHFGLNAIILRYFNVYGPGQPAVGEYGLVMGIFSRAALKGERVEIHGDGNQVRDFVHVLDVARANVASLFRGVSGLTYNVGSGSRLSVLELAREFNLEYDFGPRREGDAFETWADISTTREHLDWSPSVQLGEGIQSLLSESAS